MNNPLDISAYIIELSQKTGEPITNMKLQKLVYYSFAWYAAEKETPLFEEEILAWQYGPVVLSIYRLIKIMEQIQLKKLEKEILRLLMNLQSH